MGRSQRIGWAVGLATIATGAFAAPGAYASTGNLSGFLSKLTPQIQQTSDQICLATPSDTVTLTKPVGAHDSLVLVVAGQGYGATSPAVAGVSDNINGAWTQVTNAPGVTPDSLHYLSYSVYELPDSQAAPNGLMITVNEAAGQSAASAVALEVDGQVANASFNDSSLSVSANGVMSAPRGSSAWADRLDLTLGMFGAYQYGQDFNPGNGWTMSAAENCTAAIAISSGPTGGWNWSGSGSVPAPTVDVSEPTYYMAGTLNFRFDLATWLHISGKE